jgi:hypothetical protein
MTDELGRQIPNPVKDYGRQRRAEVQAFAEALTLGDDLGAVIRAHLYLERELNHFNEALVDPAVLRVFKPRYNQKVRLAVALGLPEHFAGPLSCIGDIRNTFAHELHPSLTEAQMKRFYESLNEDLKADAQQSFELLRESKLGAHVLRSISDLSPRDQLALYMVQLWTKLVTAVHFSLRQREASKSSGFR